MYKQIAYIIICLTMSVTTNAFAQNGNGRGDAGGQNQAPCMGMGQGGMRGQGQMKRRGWFVDLNLSQEQMLKIREIRVAQMNNITKSRQELIVKQKDLAELLATGAAAEKIREKNSQIRLLQQKISETHGEIIIEINKILTPEQRVKFGKSMLDFPKDIQ